MSDDHNSKQSIEELYESFTAQLHDLGSKIGFKRVLMDAYIDWHNKNSIEVIQGSIYARDAMKRHTLESFFGHMSDELVPEEDNSFINKLDRFYSKRLHGLGRAFALVKGQLSENESAFLAKFQEKGAEIIQEAEEALEAVENEFASYRTLQWCKMERASHFYERVMQSIADRDLNAILSAFQSEKTHKVDAEVKAQLMAKPINEYDSVLSAIISITRQARDADHLASNLDIEKDIIVEIVGNLRDDKEALGIFLDEVSSLADIDIQMRYKDIIATCFYDEIVLGLKGPTEHPGP